MRNRIKTFVFIVFISLACLGSAACSNTASKPENRILGHWVDKSTNPDYTDVHYFVSAGSLMMVSQGEAREFGYEVLESIPEKNWIKVKYDSGLVRDFQFPAFDKENPAQKVETNLHGESILFAERYVENSIWEYVDDKQKLDDPNMPIKLVDELFGEKETLNVSLDALKKQLDIGLYSFHWKEEDLTPNTKIIQAQDQGGLISFEAITHNNQLKKVSLTQLFTKDPDGLKSKKSAVGFTAFLQLLMPDVYHEEQYRWIITSFQKVRETEGKVGHLSYKGHHYDFSYNDRLEEISLSVIHDKTKEQSDKLLTNSKTPIFYLPEYRGLGIGVSEMKHYYRKDVAFGSEEGMDESFVMTKLVFTSTTDEYGKKIITGKSETDDVILTMTGQESNLKMMTLKVHENISELHRYAYYTGIAYAATHQNEVLKKQFKEWENKVYPEFENKQKTLDKIIGGNIFTKSYEKPYYTYQLYVNPIE
ncbi:hypothetical protein GPJ61_03175 [Brevibacillus formosus]|uniref:hypothetical protein n=1 Tax=Brevibacillus formosus TaxID=54913 RepID=UPI001CA4BEB5|nr:hypothetical protein [Brevibacillus formosus]MBW5466878.1 hypothetical protein [Brevibacillus formosus]